jgi:hypothetical protein
MHAIALARCGQSTPTIERHVTTMGEPRLSSLAGALTEHW